MEYGRILRRSWDVTWRYRALWVFGIIVALFSGSAGSGGGGSGNSGYSTDGRDWARLRDLSGADWATIAAAIGVIVVVGLLIAVVIAVAGAILRYLSTTAIMRMVDHTEDTGEKLRWTKGFRLGWSWRSMRLFLIDLLVSIAGFIVFCILGVFALMPLLLWVTGDTTAGILGTVATIGAFVLIIVLAIAAALLVSLLRPFVYRMAVLRDMGVFASIRQGCALVRARFSQAGTMWLIMVGIRIAYGIGMLIAFLALVCIGVLLAGIPAAALYLFGAAVSGEAAGIIMAAVVGLPLLILIVGVPILFAEGLWQVYHSTVWTLTFRELAGPADVEAAGDLALAEDLGGDLPSGDDVTDEAPPAADLTDAV